MLATVLSGHWQTNLYPDCRTNLQKSARFIRFTRVRFLLKFAIIIRIIEIALREFSGVLVLVGLGYPRITHAIP